MRHVRKHGRPAKTSTVVVSEAVALKGLKLAHAYLGGRSTDRRGALAATRAFRAYVWRREQEQRHKRPATGRRTLETLMLVRLALKVAWGFERIERRAGGPIPFVPGTSPAR